MGRDRSTALSTRSDTKELEGLSNDTRWAQVLDAEAQAACWRIVEAFSLDGAPFDLEVSWASGGGAGAKAKLTVSRSTRLCVFARALRVRAFNLSASTNRVGVTVADGFTGSRNRWEARGRTSAEQATAVEIPPFADTLRLELADPDQLSTTSLLIHDGSGTLRAKVTGDGQFSTGLALGGAAKVSIEAAAETDFRVVYRLTL